MHGRHIYNFIKSVNFVKANIWFKPNRWCVYILTEYGSIRSSLYRRNAESTNKCPICKVVEETVEHILLNCPGYEELRYLGLQKYNTAAEALIETEDQFIKLQNFAKNLFEIRRTYLP